MKVKKLYYHRSLFNPKKENKLYKSYLTIIVMLIFLNGCTEEMVNFELELVKANEIYFHSRLNTPYTGKVYSIYSNQTKKSDGYLLKGKKDGLWSEWYENGRIKSKENYSDGIADGVWKQWYLNRQLRLKASFKEGKAHGLHEEWYSNGQKKEEGTYYYNEFDGNWIKWYPEGNKEAEGKYVRNKEEGRHIFWFTNGNKKKALEKIVDTGFKYFIKNI